MAAWVKPTNSCIDNIKLSENKCSELFWRDERRRVEVRRWSTNALQPHSRWSKSSSTSKCTHAYHIVGLVEWYDRRLFERWIADYSIFCEPVDVGVCMVFLNFVVACRIGMLIGALLDVGISCEWLLITESLRRLPFSIIYTFTTFNGFCCRCHSAFQFLSVVGLYYNNSAICVGDSSPMFYFQRVVTNKYGQYWSLRTAWRKVPPFYPDNFWLFRGRPISCVRIIVKRLADV